MHGFQIWVNLPKRDKMMAPRYQEISRSEIPEGASADGLAKVKVVAGEALGVKAVIETRTPISYLHFTLKAGAKVDVPLPPDHAAYVYVFDGDAKVSGKDVREGQLAMLGEGDALELAASETTQMLVLSGVPLKEPVVQYGPFVMNTEGEIRQAIVDYQSGRLGEIAR
jgi:hypothetical protein